jgi:hypothetical protein
MQAIASHKVASVGQDTSRRCACRPSGPNRDANSVCASMQMDQDGPFASERCVGPLEMPLEQCLSPGGKDVFIKSVVQAIPTFSMSCFKLPRGL